MKGIGFDPNDLVDFESIKKERSKIFKPEFYDVIILRCLIF